MAEKVGKAKFGENVLKSDEPVLVDFYSDSCSACKSLSPALDEAEAALEGSCRFFKVNAIFEEELAEEYGILALPTLIVFQSGKEAGRRIGTQRPQELTGWLKSFSCPEERRASRE